MASSLDTSTAKPPSAPLSRHILVIDDSALIREAARIALDTIGGRRVSAATGGQEGVALATSDHPDAILLDVVMPDMDGIAVVERVRATPSLRSLPIVLLTAKDRPEDRERFRNIAISGVIAKPFDIGSLSRQLNDLLGWAA
jgi:CheY-like chemotaxis protein